MDTLNKVDADFLHQLDMDYKPLTSPYTWDLVDYKEQPKLKTGDIVTIRPDLTTSSSTLKGQYKVISYNTKNGQYGIVPARSLFDLPMYYTREELILVPPANKEESFLYKVGDVVSFKVTSSILPSSSRTLKGLITARYTDGRKYYKIEGLFNENQYEVHEIDIIERLCTSTSESEQQKAGNMENSTEEPKIRIGDIVSLHFPPAPFDSSTDNQYKVTDISLKDGEYGLVHVYAPFETPKFCNKNNLILRRKADEKTPFLFQKGDLVSFKLSGRKDVKYGQIKELLSAATNFYKIKDLKDACLYLIEESNIEKITYTAPDCKPVKLDTITGLTITKAESWSPIKTIETTGNIEEKPLNIKIVKKQIKLNFKN